MDCIWSEWSPWSSCSKTCQPEFQRQERSIVQVEKYGGKPCEGPFNYGSSKQSLKRECSEEDCLLLKSKGCNQTVCRASNAMATVFFRFANDASKTSFSIGEFYDVFSETEKNLLKALLKAGNYAKSYILKCTKNICTGGPRLVLFFG